jgi:hypothetical protein
MTSSRPSSSSRALLALACWLALLAPGAAGTPAKAPDGLAGAAAGPLAGAEPALLRDRPAAGTPATLGAKRDDRQRPALELPGPLAPALAAALVLAALAGRGGDRPWRRRPAAAADPRAPPLRPASI